MKPLKVLFAAAVAVISLNAAAFSYDMPENGKKTELKETITLGQPIEISHKTHHSTGLDFYIEKIDENYFEYTCRDVYDYPERAESMPGGDSGKRVYTLTPVKAGKVDIVEMIMFRDEIETVTHHYTIVDPNAPVTTKHKKVKKTKKTKKGKRSRK